MSNNLFLLSTYGPRRKKTCHRGFENNTGADQPAHLRRLISAFVICFLESIICKLSTGEISNFWLVSVAMETGLSLTLSDTPKTGFVASRPIFHSSLEKQLDPRGSVQVFLRNPTVTSDFQRGSLVSTSNSKESYSHLVIFRGDP